jgi:hypothetical protein
MCDELWSVHHAWIIFQESKVEVFLVVLTLLIIPMFACLIYWSAMVLASTTYTWMLCLILVWCFLDDWQNNRYYTWSLPNFWFWTIYWILHLVLVSVDTTSSGSYLALACHLVLASFLHFRFISFALPQHKIQDKFLELKLGF